MKPRLTIVGAGWAGLSAAVKATQSGFQVHLIEASSSPGGRAKSVMHQGVQFDNGQHALLGAYSATLELMKSIGLDPQELFDEQNLMWSYPSGEPYALPEDRYPLKLARSVLMSQRFDAFEKLKLLKPVLVGLQLQLGMGARVSTPSPFGSNLVASGHAGEQNREHDRDRDRDRDRALAPVLSSTHLARDTTVAQLFQGVSRSVIQDLISPLCLSAMNTPLERASANVFIRVLRDAFMDPPRSSNFLLPKRPLSEIMPERAVQWLLAQGAMVEMGRRIEDLRQLDPEGPCILALPPWQAARLTQESYPEWSQCAKNLKHNAIASVYIKGHARRKHLGPKALRQANTALRAVVCFNEHLELDRCVHPQFGVQLEAPQSAPTDGPERPTPQMDLAAQHWALIVSVADPLKRQEIIQNALLTAQKHLGLVDAQMLFCTVEKRATFSCEAHTPRPPGFIARGLWACGDYVKGPYPATLEGAVRSGLNAVQMLLDT